MELLHVVADPGDKRVPEVARACLAALGTQLLRLKQQILEFDRMIMAWHRSNQTSKRLHYIPGVGPILATALVASVADPRTFRFFGTDIVDIADVAVIDLLVVIVFDLHHFIAGRERPTKALDLALAGGVQSRLQFDV